MKDNVNRNLVILTTHFGSDFSGGSTATIEIFSRLEYQFSSITVIGTKLGRHPFTNLIFKRYRNWVHALKLIWTSVDNVTIYYGDFYNSFLFVLLRKNFFFTYHDNWPDLGKSDRKYRFQSIFYIPVYQFIFRNAKTVISVSNHHLKSIKKYSPDVRLVRNGFNHAELPYQQKERKLLMVGTIDYRKYHLAIELFKDWGHSDLKVHIYGKIADQSIADRLSSFSFVTIKGFNDLIPYSNYICLMHTSLMENLPIVFCEAIHNKVPVITFDVGGSSEIIDSEGILIKPYDCSAMQKALTQIALGKSKFKFGNGLKEFSWNQAASQYKNILLR
jgi:glycosyltransferase involved in cell wall biosynthesis